MAVIALTISILALLVAGASAWFARSQAQAQAEATAIERERRHAERMPKFEAEVEDVNDDGGFFRLWLTLVSAGPLDEIAVELRQGSYLRFVPNVHGVEDERHARSFDGELQHGDRVCWRIELSGDWTGKESFLVTARRGSEEWTNRVTVDVIYAV